MNKYAKLASAIAASGLMSLTLTGVALADSTATISGPTGQDSSNIVVINDDSSVSTTNVNKTSVVNVNMQQSRTGDVDVDKNTTVSGPVTSGSANNTNTQTTTVTVGNPGMGGTSGGGSGGNGGNGGGNGGGGSTGGSGGATGGSGSVLGASTGPQLTAGRGGGILPVTGPQDVVDVSALRALYHAPSTTTPAKALVQPANRISGAFLGVAALLSLISAIGASLYTNRRERLLNK